MTSARKSSAIALEPIADDEEKSKFSVTVQGLDYDEPKTGDLGSDGSERIAMWTLEAEYSGNSILARQVTLTVAAAKDGCLRLAPNLTAGIDLGLIETYRGTDSTRFEPGGSSLEAVKIVDDRGIESLKLVVLA